MRNPVAKHFRKVCRPTIQQSKRRQALMVANMEESNSDYMLDSVDEGCYDSGMNDVNASSIEIGDEE
mgnify:CR=1 FL=1